MSLARRVRRAAGVGALAWAIVSAGCRGLPVRRLQPALAPSPSQAAPPGELPPLADQAPPAAAPVHPLPPLPLNPVPDREALAESTPDAPEAPAPDEALIRAGHVAPEEPGPAAVGPPAEPAEAPVAAEPPTPEEPVDPFASWDEGLRRLRDLARQRAGLEGDSARTWDLRGRLLDWLATAPESEDPRPRLWETVLTALAEGPADGPVDPNGLRAAALLIEAEAPLEIVELRFCRRVLGFAEFDPHEANAFRAGQPVILYCELAGLRYEPWEDRFRSRLFSAVEILPSAGGEPVWSHAFGVADDACRRRRRDYFISYRFHLPEALPPGPYQLRLVQTDTLASRTAARTVPFSIRP